MAKIATQNCDNFLFYVWIEFFCTLLQRWRGVPHKSVIYGSFLNSVCSCYSSVSTTFEEPRTRLCHVDVPLNIINVLPFLFPDRGEFVTLTFTLCSVILSHTHELSHETTSHMPKHG